MAPSLTILSALFHGTTYLAAKEGGLFHSLPRAARIDSLSRLPSFANVAVCLYACYTEWGEAMTVAGDLTRAAFESSPTRDVFLEAVSGYMLYDLALMVWEPCVRDTLMVLHHAVVISALLTGVKYQVATFYMTCLFANEASTVFVNARFLLLHYGMGVSRVYSWNGAALAGSFFVCRVVAISALVVHAAFAWWRLAFVQGMFWTRPRSDRLLFGGLTVLLLVHWGLNLVWFSRVVAHAKRATARTRAGSPEANAEANAKVNPKGDRAS
jgi:hypothetical protein